MCDEGRSITQGWCLSPRQAHHKSPQKGRKGRTFENTEYFVSGQKHTCSCSQSPNRASTLPKTLKNESTDSDVRLMSESADVAQLRYAFAVGRDWRRKRKRYYSDLVDVSDTGGTCQHGSKTPCKAFGMRKTFWMF